MRAHGSTSLRVLLSERQKPEQRCTLAHKNPTQTRTYVEYVVALACGIVLGLLIGTALMETAGEGSKSYAFQHLFQQPMT